MLIFKLGLETVVTVNSLDQLFTQVEGDPIATPYQTDAELPDFTASNGNFYYPSNNYENSNPLQIGATKVYAKTTATFSTGSVNNFSLCCLPTPPERTGDTILYYQPTAAGLKVLLTSKTWTAGSTQYDFITNPKTLKLILYTGTNRGVYGPVVPQGRLNITGYDVAPLDYGLMVDEQTIVSTLGAQIFSKEWVEQYINDRLEEVIPQAVDAAVKQSEVVISQRYVSR